MQRHSSLFSKAWPCTLLSLFFFFLSIYLLESLWICIYIFFPSTDWKFSVWSDAEASVADEELKVASYLRQRRGGRLMLSSIQWTVMGCCQNDSVSGCHSELGSVKARRVAAAAAATHYIIIKHNGTEMVTCAAESKGCCALILKYCVEQPSLSYFLNFFWYGPWDSLKEFCLFFDCLSSLTSPQRSEP